MLWTAAQLIRVAQQEILLHQSISLLLTTTPHMNTMEQMGGSMSRTISRFKDRNRMTLQIHCSANPVSVVALDTLPDSCPESGTFLSWPDT